ncbi:MAG: IS66 family transposase [Propionibacteriaceae bacterium]|nr:IS66 family transposase [Propionibacteriaceae bacterium]
MEPVATNEVIAKQTAEAQAIIRTLLATIAKMETELEELRRQVKGKTPKNSSLPPSTQHPHAKPKSRKRKSKRKRGGQPGHKKHERPLIPTDECDDVQPLKPAECRRCGRKLTGTDPEPLRHQVWELPPIKPLVTEYQRHRLACSGCGETTCAPLPAGVPQGQSGPRLMAFTALLMAYYRQSKRRTAEFLTTLLGQPCCAALTVKMQSQVTAAARGAYEELAARLPEQEHVNADETGTKEQNDKAWLWTFVARTFTVFAVRATRAATAVDELLTTAFEGIVTCDRAKMYWRAGRLQWCWAHLKRDFQALIDGGDNQTKRLGYDLRRQTCKLFEHWGNYHEGKISRAAFVRRMAPVRREVERLLLRGKASGNKSLVGMCRELHDHRDWLWTFVRSEGVEPTNNAGERALRHAVIWRKLSFGTQSAAGSRFVETMLTVIETCRQQDRSTFDYLTAAVQAHLAGKPAPSLLPRV